MKIAKLIVGALLLASATLSQALEVKPYTPAALAAAEKADQPVALHFRADWCPTCRAQDKVLQSLEADKSLKLTVLAVNYDTEKALKRQFRVNAQSTLIVLHGPKEVARLVGDTSTQGIRAALAAAL